MLTVAGSVLGAYAMRRAYFALSHVPVIGYVAVVTGAAGGLGFQLSLELIRRGVAAVVVLDLDQNMVDAAVEKLQLSASEARISVTVRGYACNVSDSAAVKV